MSRYYFLCHDNVQANVSRVLSQKSNLCRDIKSCKVKDLCRDRKWKSNETSQDKFIATKISMLQQVVQLATKISKGNMSGRFQGLSRHRVQIQQYKTTRLCCDIENVCRDNNNRQL